MSSLGHKIRCAHARAVSFFTTSTIVLHSSSSSVPQLIEVGAFECELKPHLRKAQASTVGVRVRG